MRRTRDISSPKRPSGTLTATLLLVSLGGLQAATTSVSMSSTGGTAPSAVSQPSVSTAAASSSGGFGAAGSGKSLEAAFPTRTASKKADFFGSGKASEAAKATGTGRTLGELLRGRMLMEVEACVGLPYRQGGRRPGTGFDAAGFVQHLFRTVNRSVPDDIDGLQNTGTRLTAEQFVERNRFRDDPPRFRIGDVLFFRVFSRKLGTAVLQPVVYCGDGRAAFPSPAEGSVVIRDIRATASALAFVQRVLQN